MQSQRVAMLLGQACFGSDDDTPGDVLTTISQLRAALDFMELRYSQMVVIRAPTQTRPTTHPELAQRKRGRPAGRPRGGKIMDGDKPSETASAQSAPLLDVAQ